MNNINHRRIAIVSGGTGYLGGVIARTLAEQGMIVALLYNTTQKEDAQTIVESLPGTSHKVYRCDVCDHKEVQDTISRIEKEMGEVFACVHSAGTKPQRKRLLDTSTQEIEEDFFVHGIGGFNFLSVCAKILQAHKLGVLVGITTAGVVIPEATHSLGGYIPAKYALQGILTMIKEELREVGVRVYSVAPGFMEGGMNSDIPKAFVEIFRRKSKTQTLTTPEDVAKKIAYLCSDKAENDDILTHVVALEYGEW